MNKERFAVALAACRLLGDAANGRPVPCDQLPAEEALLGFSKAHRIETLISSALYSIGADEASYRTLHDTAAVAAFHQVKNDVIATALLLRFSSENLTVVPLKGTALQAVYPDGWIRTSTDLDLYLSAKQLDAATAVLTQEGFEQSQAHDGDVIFQKPPRTVVELHTTLGGFTTMQQQTLDRLSRVPFTVNEHYVYTLFHLYKHFLYAGAGVRMFWDMYCLSRAVTDRDCVETWLGKLGLLAFDRAVQTVGGILFDGDSCSEAMIPVVALVLHSGTFGKEDIYHAMKHAAQPVTHTNRVHAWMHDYGFDRAAMTARYPVLKRHIWLYPACTVHRVVHGAIFKSTVLKHAAQVNRAVDRRQMERVLRTMHIL